MKSEILEKEGTKVVLLGNEAIARGALEAAVGASWSGVRSLVTMKHFGLNVAADSLIPLAYTGTKAGLVIFVADDPGAWSSVQSEQDSRYYARLAKLPMLEPSNPQECLEFAKFAFELSEEFEIPVLLRTTTKVSHSIGTVVLGKLTKPESRGNFEKDPQRFYNFRPQLQELHQKLNGKMEKIETSTFARPGLANQNGAC